MMRTAAKWLLAASFLTHAALGADSARPGVSLEILTRPGLPLTASQQWYKTFSDLGVSGLQIRSAGQGEEMSISRQGGKGAASYKVVGILSADNVLYLPGGKFRAGDTAALRKWIDTLGDEGPEGVTEQRSAFGLIAKQLAEVQSDLAKPVGFSTQGMAADKAVARITGKLKHLLELDEPARGALGRVTLADDFSGLSSGTSLAAILRAGGLGLRPERVSGGDLRYRAEKPQPGVEAWPVGWKPKGRPNEVLPPLFDFLNVEIMDTSAADALDAIRRRLQVPFVYDRAAMAQHDVDPAKTMATVPNKRLTYSLILNKVLAQAKLKYELRVDEAEKPFLWISTLKPAR